MLDKLLIFSWRSCYIAHLSLQRGQLLTESGRENLRLVSSWVVKGPHGETMAPECQNALASSVLGDASLSLGTVLWFISCGIGCDFKVRKALDPIGVGSTVSGITARAVTKSCTHYSGVLWLPLLDFLPLTWAPTGLNLLETHLSHAPQAIYDDSVMNWGHQCTMSETRLAALSEEPASLFPSSLGSFVHSNCAVPAYE